MIETVRAEREKQRKRTIAALVASLLIHLLIVLVAFVILSLKPQWLQRLAPVPPPTPQPAEFTLVPPPEPPKKEERDFLDSSQGKVSETAPKDAAFESDQNMIAASERPAQSNAPVPTLDGEQGPGLTLRSQDLSLGPAPKPSAASSPAIPKFTWKLESRAKAKARQVRSTSRIRPFSTERQGRARSSDARPRSSCAASTMCPAQPRHNAAGTSNGSTGRPRRRRFESSRRLER